MPKRPGVFRPHGPASPVERERDNDRRRGSARARGYDRAWDKASLAHRRDNPLCRYCEVGAFGSPRISGVTRTDHLYPQRRYPGVFWERQWWVSSCDGCDAAKQALEHRGKSALDALARRLGLPILRGEGGANP
jgi:5-methylcytosine-specific restriction protein A